MARLKYIFFTVLLISSLTSSKIGYSNITVSQENLCISNHPFTAQSISNEVDEFETTLISLNENQILELINELDSLIKIGDIESEENAILLIEYVESNYSDKSELLLEIYHVGGKIFVNRSDTKKGLELLFKCIELKKEYLGDSHTELAKTYNYIGIAFHKDRNIEKALEYYTMSANILEANDVKDINLFDACMNIGIVYSMMSKYDFAYEYLSKASIILSNSNINKTNEDIASFYINYGAFTAKLGKLNESNSYYNKADSLLKIEDKDFYKKRASLYLNKGNNSYFNLDFSNAILHYNTSISLNQESDNPSSRTISRCYNNLAAVSLKLNEFKKAEEYCIKGLQTNSGVFLKVKLSQNLATSYMYQGSIELAKEYFIETLSLLENSPPSLNNFKIQPYISFAIFLHSIKDKQSLKYYQDALTIARNIKNSDSRNEAYILSRIGLYYLEFDNNLQLAQDYYEKSLKLWEEYFSITFDSNKSSSNEIRFVEAFTGYSLVFKELHEQTNDIEYLLKSEKLLEEVIQKLDLISNNINDENLLVINNQIEGIFDDVLSLNYEIYTDSGNEEFLDKGFQYSEKSKSSVLVNSIMSKDALKVSGIPQELITEEERLMSEIEATRKLIFDEKLKQNPKTNSIAFYESRLLNLKASQDSLLSRLELEFPKYFGLKYKRNVAETEDILESLNNNEALIEYEITDNELFIFLLADNSKYFFSKGLDDKFYSAIDTLLTVRHSSISHHDSLNFKSFINNSHYLYEILLGDCHNLIEKKKLIIIPDGILGYVPFDILLSEKTVYKRINYSKLKYLIIDHPISYNYSATIRYDKINLSNLEIKGNRFLGIAPEYASEEKNTEYPSEYLSNLRFSEKETESIKDKFGGKIYKGKRGSKNNFLKDAPNFDIIHLSQHALLNDSLPMYSRLAFANSGLSINESSLFTYEIYNLKLKAKMVTLSACSTGSGKLNSSEGIMSLARGFIYAGVPSITMTLWEAEDRYSSEIMVRYYNYIRDGFEKDIALQRSKLDYLSTSNQNESHPFFWASYIVTGSTDQILIKKPISKLYYWGIGLFIILIILFRLRKRYIW